MSWLPAAPVLRWAVLGAVALALVGGIAGAGWAWYSAQEARAREAFALVGEQVQQAQTPPPGATGAPAPSAEARARAIAALEAVIAQHPRASIVPQAAYQLGNLRYAAGQYAQARGAFEVALSGATGTLRALSALGVAYTWEAEKNQAKALAAYEAALAGRGPKDFLFEELLMDLARVQEFGGQPQAAIATYERLLKDVPDSRRADDVRSRIATLKSAGKS